MAYGNKYYLDFYDRFNNLIKVYIQEEGYGGAVTDVTGGGEPLKIHWIGEGDDKYKVIKGSTCDFNVVSTTDQQFLSIFTDTSRKYKMVVYKDSDIMWTGMVDPDSYKEPFLYQPYVSTIHASDGMGELKNINFPKPDSTDLYSPELQLAYYVAEALKQTGHELDIRIACNINYTGAFRRILEDVTVFHKSFRDEENNFESCYEVLEKILTSIGCRVYQWMGSWYIDRLDYMRQTTVDYHVYDSSGAYQSTSSSVDPKLTMTDVSGSPLCVWVNQSPNMEISPAWKEVDVSFKPGEMKNVLVFTNPLGEFIDDEFEHPPVIGPLEPRYWTKYLGDPLYGILTTTKYPATDYWQLRSVAYAHQTYKNIWGNVRSDVVTLEHQSLKTFGSLRFKVEFKASIGTTNDDLFYYKPFLRWNMKMVFPNAEWAGSMPIGFIKSSPGNTLTIYFYEDEDNKLQVTTASDWIYELTVPASTHPYPGPGVNTFQFEELGETKEFSINTEPIKFEEGYDEEPTIQMLIYPLFCLYYLDGPEAPTYPLKSYDYNMDVHYARVTLLDEDLGFDGEATMPIDSDNRHKPGGKTYWFTSGTPDYNKKFYNKYIFLDLSADYIPAIWTVDGVEQGALITQIMLPELRTQHLRPMRKLTGELCANPDSMDFGKILIDPYSKKYFCAGVEYDAKQAFWNGEWMQLHDPEDPDAGDYDASDFSTGDFWAI